MEYKENGLSFEDYCQLRESVDWLLFSKEQTQEALNNSLYTVTAVEDNQTVGMGRLIGDGMYYMIVDIVVHPIYQKKGLGTNITNMLVEYVKNRTPLVGVPAYSLRSYLNKIRTKFSLLKLFAITLKGRE